ncbi:hypothetical protein BIV02_08215 [Curtobacterium sp. MMLR14_014]|uniref:hypothetical protein n=1 Tax=unclassified Curtobacterium TaxID=257496 RepID=UPI0008F81ABB|nr:MULTISPECIES: hypothetical protein [unclassified Curtobacterium]OII34059.1 hypothetical protein BIU91_04965 [Curtobacterium sp. MMLR14_002]OII40709.1 hypothetical protein BIV02_08215 [Curtobacterium sp. MMLR14_014]
MTDRVVRFTPITRLILAVGFVAFTVFCAVSALVIEDAAPMWIVAALFALMWWRFSALKVEFAPAELILTGLISRRRIPRGDVLRIEEGTTVIRSRRGHEHRIIIPIAMSYSHITDNTPDARVKQRIDRAYRRWAAETVEDTEQDHSEG